MSERPSFSLDVARGDAGPTVVVAGELDLTTADAFREAVSRQLRSGRVLADLRAVAFMDSSGVAAVDALLKQAQADGAELLVGGPLQGAVVRVLEMTGMLGALRLVEPGAAPSS